jgi:hypothetical protein
LNQPFIFYLLNLGDQAMSILNTHNSFVKQQSEFHRRMAKKYAFDPKRQLLHISTAEKFEVLASDINDADKKLDDPLFAPKPITLEQQLNLFPKELDDLPEDLKKELSSSDADIIERLTLTLMEEAGGIISLDRILVGLYRKTGEINKRVTMTSRMYRMAQKGYVYYVPGKKGVYSVRKMSPEEATALFAIPEEGPETP